jgi:DNA-binding NtrC family response regulator
MNQADTPATVLLVDDEANLLEVYTEGLLPHFQSDRASSVKEAEALMKTRTYKVVVTDYNMPGGDGLAFLTRVRERYPHTVRLLVTSHMDPRFLTSLRQAEPFRYLLKPVSRPQLLKAVEDATKLHDQGQPKT